MFLRNRTWPGTSTNASSRPDGSVRPGEAEVDGEAPRLLLGEPVGVGAGERQHERRLAVVDVTGGGDDVHRAQPSVPRLDQQALHRPTDPALLVEQRAPAKPTPWARACSTASRQTHSPTGSRCSRSVRSGLMYVSDSKSARLLIPLPKSAAAATRWNGVVLRRPRPARGVGSSRSPVPAPPRSGDEAVLDAGVVECRPLCMGWRLASLARRRWLLAGRLLRHGDRRGPYAERGCCCDDASRRRAVGPRRAGPCVPAWSPRFRTVSGATGTGRSSSTVSRAGNMPSPSAVCAGRSQKCGRRPAVQGVAIPGSAGEIGRLELVRGQSVEEGVGHRRQGTGGSGSARMLRREPPSRPWHRRRARPCGGPGWSVPPGSAR